ncbi:hypothetical protein [Lelliottia nimipressuralis]|uniref:Tail fiber protein n=1 Tax=Lelliottia nimipressuralis TaxID=69220 RepID=A0ABD4KHW4_9ENTR|nr:hypothetical protein [Lelliottia nimipressuralis]MBF4180596.1 hypothetical protein [Lelliottia nimipressuralis]
MPVESATYISDLVPDWPVGASDFVKEGDDHIRGIKKCIQNTLPNIDGPVTGTPTQLNNLTSGFNFVAEDETQSRPPTWQAVDATDGSGFAAIQALTPTAAQYAAFPDLAITMRAVMNMMMPVGHVLMTSKAGNPSTWLGFGTWTERFGYLAASGNITDTDGVTGSYPLGQGKGYWHPHDSHLWDDSRDFSTESDGEHVHKTTVDIRNSDNGHYGDSGYGGTATTKTYTSDSEESAHVHKGSVTIGTKELPLILPGFGCYVWERTA